VFFARGDLEQAPAVATISRSDTTAFTIASRTRKVYQAAQVSWQNATTKSLISQTVQGREGSPGSDTLKLSRRCEDEQQAMLKADAALRAYNAYQSRAALTLLGTTALAAGSNINCSGFGVFDGKYLIEMARHRLDRDRGYTTDVEVRLIG